jgi:hypothetical protein
LYWRCYTTGMVAKRQSLRSFVPNYRSNFGLTIPSQGRFTQFSAFSCILVCLRRLSSAYSQHSEKKVSAFGELERSWRSQVAAGLCCLKLSHAGHKSPTLLTGARAQRYLTLSAFAARRHCAFHELRRRPPARHAAGRQDRSGGRQMEQRAEGRGRRAGEQGPRSTLQRVFEPMSSPCAGTPCSAATCSTTRSTTRRC